MKVGDTVKLKPAMWQGIKPESYGLSFTGEYVVEQYIDMQYPAIKLEGINGKWDAGAFELVNKELRFTLRGAKPQEEAVHSPKHYAVFDDVEAIEIIARSMTKEMFKGYCFGNLLKYRLRAGNKDDVKQELGKADKYKELYNKYKDLCQ